MKNITMTSRILLGLIFLVFGMNGFFNFLPQPTFNDSAGVFIGGLVGSGYFFQFLKICEVSAGALLILGFFVPLALVLLAPITINIFLFHFFLENGGLLVSIVILVLHTYLAFAYKNYYKQLFTFKANP